MNRLRKISDKYEFLITPQLIYQTGFELMLGNWTDKNFGGFAIKEYTSKNIQNIISTICQYPEINFDQLILFHKEIYNKLYELIIKDLEKINDQILLIPKLLNSYELRDNFFNRVKILGDDFRLLYHMTDIISFNINVTNEKLASIITEILSSNQSLKILYGPSGKFYNKQCIKI